ncbi:MAG: hypothetical protein NTY53_15505, partial [Kiritimatiellaeota bacterium]|nr:hypothetical protein [Kiritimatiellota bacterium]
MKVGTRLTGWMLAVAAMCMAPAMASEADLILPDLGVKFFNGAISGTMLMMIGIGVCALGLVFGLVQYTKTKNLP